MFPHSWGTSQMKTQSPSIPDPRTRTTRVLLWCGVVSSLWYAGMNVYVPMNDSGYEWMSQTVSELSAIGAPTRLLWVGLGWIYTLLLTSFGWGVWRAGVRGVGLALILQGVLNPFWPPMHLRTVLAAGGGTLMDSLHIAFTAIWGVLSLLIMGLGAASLGPRFRLYTLVSVALLFFFGGLTAQEVSSMEANLPTPWMGVWERLNIGVFMLWIVLFALARLRRS
jgi:hypothetical protein